MPTRRLAIVLSTPHERGDLHAAAAIAHGAAALGAEVSLFAMHRGVHACARDPRTLSLLIEDGCHIVVCATGLSQADDAALPQTVVRGSQDDHAAMVGHADKVVAFT